ncbi:Eco57I restriction-modification methylase domain-containing protein [Oscillospiraceae bacterium WX1]
MRELELLDNIIIGRVEPHIYAFITNTIPNYIKIGDTYRPVSVRLKEWQKYYPELKKQFENTAKVANDIYFRDYAVHQYLESELLKERLRPEILAEEIYFSNEFFEDTTATEISDAIVDITGDYNSKGNKYQFYNALTALPTTVRYASTGYWEPRPNQQVTINAFKRAVENGRSNLLMYAVMRFGKSFTSMCCAKEMNDGNGARLVVVVSAKADVKEEWRKTVECAENFRNDYEFLSSVDLERNHSIVTDTLNKDEGANNVVLFLTLQDLQGDVIKDKHQQIFGRKVDLLIIDETHFGARADVYGKLLRDSQFKGEKAHKRDDDDYVEITDAEVQIKGFDTKVKLHLSGTPYRILMGGEFEKEDIIAFYQFSDIVQEQEAWDYENLLRDEDNEGKSVNEWDNPYYGFPQMVRFAFNLNESSIRRLEELCQSGVTYAFSALLKPKSIKKADDNSHKKFVYESEILDLLAVIDGSQEDENLLGFLDYERIKSGMMCRHIVIVLPYCASCDSLEVLIKNNGARFKNLGQYEIINISGVEMPNAYMTPRSIHDVIKKCEAEGKKTITLTVNRMLTGSTVEEWDTMLFLKDTASPQEYDQAIFRLQNQYVKTYKEEHGDIIKHNMKPQTLLVDFDPNRMFRMQEQKAQIYNVNVDDAGNSKLSERLSEELRISPIIVMNKDKIELITAADILKAISRYSQNRGVAEETNDIPVDLSLMGIADIWDVIRQENELGSKAGFEIKAAEGEGGDTAVPEPGENDDHDGDSATGAGDANANTEADETEENTDTTNKDPAKQFRMYYARILYFAFLTKDTVISLEDIIASIESSENARIFSNLGLSKTVLKALKNHMDKFMLRALDYKIQNLNQLSNDDSIPPLERATVANQKFGKLGESQVVTPTKICDDMIALLPDEFLLDCVEGGKGILDIASKEGEFSIALCKRFESLGFGIRSLKDLVYSIPTSTITYEFTRKIYELLGLNTANIIERFTSYDLLNIRNDCNDLDFTRIRAILNQNKTFNEITIKDNVVLGGEEKMVKFGAIVGNPPYQEGDGGAQKSARPIYQYFVVLSKELDPEYMTFIIPSRWYAGGKGLGKFRNAMLNDIHIQKLDDFLHPEELFPDTNNRGGVCYFLWNKNYDNSTSNVCVVSHEGENKKSVANRSMKTKDLDIFVRSSRAIAILDKIVPNNDVDTMMNHISPRKPFGLDGNFIETAGFHKSADCLDTPIKCYGKAKTVGYVERAVIKVHAEWIDNWKVLLPYANNIGTELNDDNQNTFVVEPPSVCTETYLIAGADLNLDESASKNLSNYLRTRFARFLLSLAKISQHGTAKTYRFAPTQDFTNSSDIDWNKLIPEIDNQLYLKYGLTMEEIAYIESKIKLMD